MIEQNIINILNRQIEGIICIYLFGSFSEGTCRRNSDIDIAVLAKGEWDNIRRWEIAGILSNELNKDIDLINLESSSTVLKAQILTKGKCVYESDKLTKDLFEMYSLSDYARLNEERKEIIEKIKKEGRVYA